MTVTQTDGGNFVDGSCRESHVYLLCRDVAPWRFITGQLFQSFQQ